MKTIRITGTIKKQPGGYELHLTVGDTIIDKMAEKPLAEGILSSLLGSVRIDCTNAVYDGLLTVYGQDDCPGDLRTFYAEDPVGRK